MATVVLSHSPAAEASRSPFNGRTGLYSSTTFWQSFLAVAVLPLHVFSPNMGLLARALVQSPITWSAQFDSLMPLLLTSLSWQSFERTTSGGFYADAATGLEGYAYIFGVSLMIIRYVTFRAGYPRLAGKSAFDRRFLVLCLLLALTLVAAYRGAIAGERGWSSPFRAALTAGGFFYGIILAQTYGPSVKMMAGFYLPAGLIFYGLSSLGYLDHRLIWTLAPFVSAAGGYILATQPLSWSGLGAAATLAVSGWRCVLGPMSTGTLVLLWSCGLLVALFATRQSLGLGRLARRPVILIVAASMIIATIYVTLNKQEMAAEAVRREESISRYLWWKLVEDRGLIWSQAMDAFVSRPLSDILFVPGGASIELRYGGKFYNMKIGLHNAYLDVIYYMGLVPGGLFCCYILLLCWDCLKALGQKLPADIEIMAFGVLITAIVGGFSGQYFIHQEGGTWFYLPAGIVSGYYFRHRPLESASRPALSPGLR
jgi:hypothetical protein